jgi:hypothetical protein
MAWRTVIAIVGFVEFVELTWCVILLRAARYGGQVREAKSKTEK